MGEYEVCSVCQGSPQQRVAVSLDPYIEEEVTCTHCEGKGLYREGERRPLITKEHRDKAIKKAIEAMENYDEPDDEHAIFLGVGAY